MSELTYDDFKSRVNIQDLLVDAGYQLNRRDGMRYPSYVRIGSDGKRAHGDKFIVTANGLCCFQPPEKELQCHQLHQGASELLRRVQTRHVG